MKKVGYFLSISITLLWVGLILVWIMLENFYPVNLTLIISILAIMAMISFVFLFMYRYYKKYKSQVHTIKKQYLISLKPKRPLKMYGYYEPESKVIDKLEGYKQSSKNLEKDLDQAQEEINM